MPIKCFYCEPQSGWLKITEVYSFIVLGPEAPINSVTLPTMVLGDDPLQTSSGFWWLLVSLACGHTLPFAFTPPSLCVTSVTRAIPTGFGAYLDNPGWARLKIFHLAPSEKTHFLSNVIFTGSSRHTFWRATIQPSLTSILRVPAHFLPLQISKPS
jgi:hypothetical protein